jgi:hypothetical protein
MNISRIQRTLSNRAMFGRGLYSLMTDEEREYFWVREADAVLRSHRSDNGAQESVPLIKIPDDPD